MSHKTQRSQDFPDGGDAHLKSPSEGLSELKYFEKRRTREEVHIRN